jgi:hypothetical protein
MMQRSDSALESGRLWIAARLREMITKSAVPVWDFRWASQNGKHELTVKSKKGSHSISIEDLVLRRVLDTFSMRPRFEATLQAMVDGIVTENLPGH